MSSTADDCSNCDVERLKGANALELEQTKASHAEQKASADHARTEALETAKAAQERAKAELDAELAALEAADQHDRELRSLFHTKLAEVASGAIERSRDSAKFLQTAAAALAGTYTALLGLVFSATERPLPARGVYAALFLGLSVGLGIAYLAYLRAPSRLPAYRPSTSLADTQINRTANLIAWSNSGAGQRSGFLRAAVVSFAAGVAFIPAAFVGPTSPGSTASTPTPPVVPERIPPAVAEPAAELFSFQVEAYFEAVNASKSAAGESPSPPAEESCSGPLSPVRTCGYSTEQDVERSFRWLALYALAAVIVIPFVLGYGRRSSTASPTNDTSQN